MDISEFIIGIVLGLIMFSLACLGFAAVSNAEELQAPFSLGGGNYEKRTHKEKLEKMYECLGMGR
jgi:hypothetical protein